MEDRRKTGTLFNRCRHIRDVSYKENYMINTVLWGSWFVQDGEAWGMNENAQQYSSDKVGISNDRDPSKLKCFRVASWEGAAEKGDTQQQRALKKTRENEIQKTVKVLFSYRRESTFSIIAGGKVEKE